MTYNVEAFVPTFWMIIDVRIFRCNDWMLFHSWC